MIWLLALCFFSLLHHDFSPIPWNHLSRLCRRRLSLGRRWRGLTGSCRAPTMMLSTACRLLRHWRAPLHTWLESRSCWKMQSSCSSSWNMSRAEQRIEVAATVSKVYLKLASTWDPAWVLNCRWRSLNLPAVLSSSHLCRLARFAGNIFVLLKISS